jgi:5-methylcytosine-specific restriction enzyme subunit McrC
MTATVGRSGARGCWRVSEARSEMGIPVQNIYYLLCYAWDEFAPKQLAKIASEEFFDVVHLFASLLASGVWSLHQRGFEKGYVNLEHATSSPRGRIMMAETLRLVATQPARVYSAYDEMSADVLTNQILKATLGRILETSGLHKNLRAEARSAWRLFDQVSDIALTPRVFCLVQLHQNNRLYAFLINVCRFLFESLQPLDRAGGYRFQDVLREPERLRRIYEKFVRNFYRRSQSEYTVKRDHMDWVGTPLYGADFSLIPQMKTDVTLRSPARCIVVECKYTESLYQVNYFKSRFRSGHLYQLAAYLQNLGPGSEGILLYPTAGVEVDQSYELHGHHVRVATLDLRQSWPQIASSLLALLDQPRRANI